MSFRVYVLPKPAHVPGLTGMRVAVLATHPAGGFDALAAMGADGVVAQAARDSARQAPGSSLFSIAITSGRAYAHAVTGTRTHG